MSLNKPAKGPNGALGFAVAGSIMTILFLVYINVTTSRSFPWSIFPAYLILWWPLGIYFAKRPSHRIISILGSLITIAFFGIMNYLTTPGYPWILYVIFAVVWWPLSAFTTSTRHYKLFAFLGAALVLAFLVIDNYVFSPIYLWVIYTIPPLIVWPVLVSLGRRAGSFTAAVVISLMVIAYYAALNRLIAPGFPWVIFPAYAVLWWPVSVATAKKGLHLTFAVSATIMSAAFFVAVNLITSPSAIWWIYPVFAFLWWPISIYYFVYKRRQKAA